MINTDDCSTAWHNENNYERSYSITEKVRSSLSLLLFYTFVEYLALIIFDLSKLVLHFPVTFCTF